MKETQQLLSSIEQRNFSPIYLLMGSEPYFIDQITEALLATVVEETARDFDTTIVYGKETSVDQIIEAAKRFPMMGNHQLIVVKEAQYLDRSIDQLLNY